MLLVFPLLRLSIQTPGLSIIRTKVVNGADEDYGFNKTIVPVQLAQYGNDKLISRSQAKRVVARLELFKTVLFDFEGVPTIGQAFADEIFRVFANEHPQITIITRNASSEVKRMIERTKQNLAPIPPVPVPITD
jgi:hypothetical protein